MFIVISLVSLRLIFVIEIEFCFLARNILVGELDVVKIADFGLAKILQGGRLMVDRESQFPIKWTAPEAATKKEYTTKSDVWSFGILLYELVTHGSNPYPGMSNNEALQAVLSGYRMPKVSDFESAVIMMKTLEILAKRLS
jgi:serine/threonine protein kinase